MAIDTAPPPLLGRYALTVAAIWVGLLVLGILLSRLLGFSLPGGAVAVIPPMIAAQRIGLLHVREMGRALAGAEAWRLSIWGAFVYAAMQALLAAIVGASLLRAGRLPDGVLVSTVLLVVGLGIVTVLVNRLFLHLAGRARRRH